MNERNISLLRYKNELTKDFLYKEYINNKKSISQLKKELNKDWNTINYYLKLHKISIRTHKEQASISSPGGKYKYISEITKNYLLSEYVRKKKGIANLSKELNVDRGTIRRYLKKYKIHVRSDREQMTINHPPKEFDLTEKARSFIDGLLLGDASIPQRKNGISPRSFTQACKYKEYLDHIQKRLLEIGVTCSPILSRWIKDERCKNKGYTQHFLQTRRYKTFEIFRERWYKSGKKIIPKDLKITPDLLLQSYLCDGNFYREIRLCLDAFSKTDILFLKKLIEEKLDINMRLVKTNDKFELAIKKSDSEKFLNYIENYIEKCPVNCYGYKWKDNESKEAKERKRLKARLIYHKNVQSKRV